jgi:hypothetical protein
MASAHGAEYVSTHPTFVARVSKALRKVAADVLAETNANHAERLPFAQKVIANDRGVIGNAITALASINASSIDIDSDTFGLTDAQIETAVANGWNTLAGVDTGSTS